MVIANGFITTDRQTALQQLIEQSDGHDIRIAVMPPLCSMTYFISDIGEVYGCQLLRNICLTKPIKIERRYSKGCHIRYSTSPGHQTNAYMQYIMYATFITGQWDDTLQLEPIDGNPYNYRLDNLRVKDESADVFYTNLNTLKEVYRSHFIDVAHYTRLFSPIDMQDAKDIASDAFLEICRTDYGYSPDNFVGLWKFKAKQRTLDFLSIKNRFDSLFYENGEERFHNKKKLSSRRQTHYNT